MREAPTQEGRGFGKKEEGAYIDFDANQQGLFIGGADVVLKSGNVLEGVRRHNTV
jgi:hypothetical protein